MQFTQIYDYNYGSGWNDHIIFGSQKELWQKLKTDTIDHIRSCLHNTEDCEMWSCISEIRPNPTDLSNFDKYKLCLNNDPLCRVSKCDLCVGLCPKCNGDMTTYEQMIHDFIVKFKKHFMVEMENVLNNEVYIIIDPIIEDDSISYTISSKMMEYSLSSDT